MKNYELSNDKKISTPFIFDILQGTVFTHVPRQYLGQIFPWKIIVYRDIRFTITQHLFSTIAALNLKRSGQGIGYGERKKKKKKKKKTKGTHFSTGPTTSSRHSKKTKGTHFSTGPTTSSRHSNKTKGTHYCADYL